MVTIAAVQTPRRFVFEGVLFVKILLADRAVELFQVIGFSFENSVDLLDDLFLTQLADSIHCSLIKPAMYSIQNPSRSLGALKNSFRDSSRGTIDSKVSSNIDDMSENGSLASLRMSHASSRILSDAPSRPKFISQVEKNADRRQSASQAKRMSRLHSCIDMFARQRVDNHQEAAIDSSAHVRIDQSIQESVRDR